jgi:hypothetical protein
MSGPCKLRDVPNIVEYSSRPTRKVELYDADPDDCTMLRISNAYGVVEYSVHPFKIIKTGGCISYS